MNPLIELPLLAGLIVLAFIAVYTPKLRRAAVYLGAFSLLCSFVFLLYNAPDVAIAEAVIGCTISTILLLIAIKKRHMLTIYYVLEHGDEALSKERRELCASLERFLIAQEFEPQIISTHLNDKELCDKASFDLLVVHEKNDVTIYSKGLAYLVPKMREFSEKYGQSGLSVAYHALDYKEDLPDDQK